jgi:threonine/homoserine/homoserine lactone efflux protein
MDPSCFNTGVALGFLLCAPLGPVGILCIRHALCDGRLAGTLAVLGAAVADAIYCLMAAFGIALVASFLDLGRLWVQAFGGLVLVGVGFSLWRRPPEPGAACGCAGRTRLLGAFLSTFLVMLSNPLPILVISAALSAMSGPALASAPRAAPLLMAGVFFGSLLWAPILVIGASALKPLLRRERLQVLQRACGAALLVCGLVLGASPLLRFYR